jgi:hypothetical protein
MWEQRAGSSRDLRAYAARVECEGEGFRRLAARDAPYRMRDFRGRVRPER